MSRKPKHVAPMTHEALEANLQAQETATVVETTWQAAESVAPATIEVEVGAPAPVEAPSWVPMPNYAKTVENTLARKSVAPHSPQGAVSPATLPVLVSCANPNVRAGTARAAALAALQASIGQPRPVVLAAVTTAELDWHKANGRTPGNLSPTGWLRTFGAVFGPAVVASEAASEVEA
jgi:hypothetical protein